MLIALTGGIAAGKSTVAEVWSRLGADVIDSDELARVVVQPGSSGLNQLVGTFGASLLKPDGALDRDALGRIVFSDSAKRKELESILHPLIRELANERFAKTLSQNVVYAIPLLVEAGSSYQFDRVCTVSAPEAVRIARLVAARGMSPGEATARVQSQVDDSARESIADVVIDSDCSLDELRLRAEQAWVDLLSPVGGSRHDSR